MALRPPHIDPEGGARRVGRRIVGVALTLALGVMPVSSCNDNDAGERAGGLARQGTVRPLPIESHGGLLQAIVLHSNPLLTKRASLGAEDIALFCDEAETAGGALESWSRVFEFGYRPIGCGALEPESFFVIGRVANGDVVLEVIKLGFRPSGWYAWRPSLDTPSVFTIPSSTGQPSGGLYLPVDERTPHPGRCRAPRTEVYRGPRLAGLTAVVGDPEGRFLFVLNAQGLDDRELLAFKIDDGTLMSVSDSTATPTLLDASNMWIEGAAQGRRLLFVHDSNARPMNVFEDVDNDGVFDHVHVFDDLVTARGTFDRADSIYPMDQ